MTDTLTAQEQMFIDALFEHNGNVSAAKKAAGYADGTNAYAIRERLADVIIERAKLELATHAPRAVHRVTEVMDDPIVMGASMKLAAAKEILDRVGLTKQDRVAVAVSAPTALLILPAKNSDGEIPS